MYMMLWIKFRMKRWLLVGEGWKYDIGLAFRERKKGEVLWCIKVRYGNVFCFSWSLVRRMEVLLLGIGRMKLC